MGNWGIGRVQGLGPVSPRHGRESGQGQGTEAALYFLFLIPHSLSEPPIDLMNERLTALVLRFILAKAA